MSTFARAQSLILAAAAALVLAGCPSNQPTGPLTGPPTGSPVGAEAKVPKLELPPDSADDAAALKAANAWLTADKSGRVTRVELGSSATDEQLKHLAGLPAVQRLQCNSRGITDAGLVHSEGPSQPAVYRLRANLHHRRRHARPEGHSQAGRSVSEEDRHHSRWLQGPRRDSHAQANSRPQTNFNNDCLEAIRGMKQLEVLDLSDCNLVTEEGLVVVKDFPNLKFLRLWGQTIDDNVLANITELANLRALSLEQSKISVAGFEHIAKLTNLQELMLYGATGVTDACLEKIQGLTKLQRLELRETRVTSLGLSYLKEMKDLKRLDVNTTTVGNEGLEHIHGLSNLEDLDLQGTRIDDAGVVNLEGLPKLKWLKLDQCNIGDKAMKTVGKLSNLEYLHIGSDAGDRRRSETLARSEEPEGTGPDLRLGRQRYWGRGAENGPAAARNHRPVGSRHYCVCRCPLSGFPSAPSSAWGEKVWKLRFRHGGEAGASKRVFPQRSLGTRACALQIPADELSLYSGVPASTAPAEAGTKGLRIIDLRNDPIRPTGALPKSPAGLPGGRFRRAKSSRPLSTGSKRSMAGSMRSSCGGSTRL